MLNLQLQYRISPTCNLRMYIHSLHHILKLISNCKQKKYQYNHSNQIKYKILGLKTNSSLFLNKVNKKTRYNLSKDNLNNSARISMKEEIYQRKISMGFDRLEVNRTVIKSKVHNNNKIECQKAKMKNKIEMNKGKVNQNNSMNRNSNKSNLMNHKLIDKIMR